MATQAQITIEPARWSERAALVLGASIRKAPGFTVADYRRELRQGAKLFRVACEGLEVGFVLLKVERYSQGCEGVIVAGAGALAGVDLVATMVPVFERYFQGVQHVRINTARPGLVRKLARIGYEVTHYTLRKAVA